VQFGFNAFAVALMPNLLFFTLAVYLLVSKLK
jgi:hypothetical protein